MVMNETIVGIATPFGVGAISLMRISGAQAREIAERVIGKPWSEAPRYASLQSVLSDEGELLDEVLMTYFKSPSSFTGEETIEIAGHGGAFVTQRVYERVIECGARAAAPGEFSQRAFMNGKLDLTQAEGIMDVISAQTDLALKAAHQQREGRIGKRTEGLRQRLIEILAHLEAFIDFPEDDIDPETGAAMIAKITTAEEEMESLLSTAAQGRILREGARVVICGEPNVGKSSLLNAFLGYERAIVSDVAGTTRDTVEEVLNVGGLPVRLVDTAGVRETEDNIEQQGVERALAQVGQADLAIEVVDVSQMRSEGDSLSHGASHSLRLLNKSDLGIHPSWEGESGILFSCLDEKGLSHLSDAILNLLIKEQGSRGAELVAINARHQDCLRRAKQSLETTRLHFKDGVEFAAVDLRLALDAIGEIAGRVDTEEILGEIFGTFCIGK